MNMATILRCLSSPRLYYIFGKNGIAGHEYQPNIVEKCGDAVVKWFRFCWSFSCWTSPVLLVIMYRRDVFSYEGMVNLSSYGSSLSLVLVLALWMRAVGRYANSDYTEFLGILRAAKKHMSSENKYKLSQYDFDFRSWPVEFSSKRTSPMVQLSVHDSARGIAHRIKALPCHILSYLAIHTFGRRFVYPGTTALLQTLVANVLLQGRIKLKDENKAERYKLKTQDNNEIASIVVDRRNDPNFAHGDTLVICCEGNAGFYEIGCMATPLQAGYSTLGWNHPGFVGSTGAPFPDQEQYAIDAVVQFATHHLGFQLHDIIVYGWSIGGYSVSWAAMNYPQVKSVIVDATFDDLTPLAIARMPQSWKTLVQLTIKKYMNLKIADQLCKYPGPILVIRRSRDEMITTLDPTIKSSNRGNFLLMKLLGQRYPNIMKEDTLPILTDWLCKDPAAQVVLYAQHEVDDSWCESILRSYAEEHSGLFPMLVGEDLPLEARKQLVLFLANNYMDEFDATHCQPLPHTYFRQPWVI